MKIGENLGASVDYAKMLFSDAGRLLILIILAIIPIVNLVVVGYIGEILKHSVDSKKLPPLEKYWSLWVQGLKIAVVCLIYMIIPFVLIAPFVFVFSLSWAEIGYLPTYSWIIVVPLLIIGTVLAFFLAIIFAMAIVNMVRKNSFGKAFAVGEITSLIGRIGWSTYLLWIIVIFVIAVIVELIGSIPVVGWIIALVLSPLFGIFSARSASLVYLEGTSSSEEETEMQDTKSSEALEPPMTPSKFCTKCGAKVPAGSLYCSECGKKQ